VTRYVVRALELDTWDGFAGYPHDTGGKKKSVLCSGTRTLFERAGSEYIRSDGLGNCVMRRTVP
jgi:hypothetical protein